MAAIVSRMPRSLVLTACLLAIAAAVSTWFWWPRDATPLRFENTDSYTNYPATNPASGDTVDTGVSRFPSNSEAAAAAPQWLKVQLRGLHADAPWTAALQLELTDRGRGGAYGEHSASASIQTDGRCEFELPHWWQPGAPVALRINGDNAGYRPLAHRQKGKLTLRDGLTLEVQAIAELRGKVSDSRGQAIANARISAFAIQAGQPYGEAVGTTGTDEQGQYVLRAPPDVPLQILATAMQANPTRWRGQDGVNDNGRLRGDLLPATLPVQLDMLHAGKQCDFQLSDAATIAGSVRWPDNQPVSGALLRFKGGDGHRLVISPHSELCWQADRTVVACGTALVDARGQFSVPAPKDTAIQLAVVEIASTTIIGELPSKTVTGPAAQDFMLPFPVTLRAIHATQLIPYARILMQGLPPLRAAADGTCNVLLAATTTVRAELGPLRSAWQSIASSQLRQVIDFEMSNQLVPMHIEFEGSASIRNATLYWHCEDGRQQTERLTRGDGDNNGDDPFVIWLEPGKYDLRISAATGERNDSYLLAIERAFQVQKLPADSPVQQLVVPARFGGNFTLQVLDENSRYVAGTCTVLGPDGKDYTAAMSKDGMPGAFAATTSHYQDILPPGPYELVLNLGAGGVYKRYVTIQELVTTSVVVRL